MIELCNRTGSDPWFCMPHLADDEFIRNFAAMVKERLDPSRRIYIEYSNEVWNTRFPQAKYSWKKGAELNLGRKEYPWEGGGMYYAQRSLEIFKIWEEVFGDHERFVRVLAWQTSTHWIENIVLTHQNANRQADALAIAPFMGMSIPIKGQRVDCERSCSLERGSSPYSP